MPLYICATPIGNLEDITLRAIRTLREVEQIAAEDTRQTKILLNKYEIKTPLTSYHKFNLKTKTAKLISSLKAGKSIALVSDAGLPGISDPGSELTKAAIENGIKVIPIPGPSAGVTALSISGLPVDKFVFEGFISKPEIANLKNQKKTLILYEAPHRIVETLKNLREVLGNRRIAVCRELTKKFEEIYRGTLDQIIPKVKPKGEFVIIIEGSQTSSQIPKNLENLVNALVSQGLSRKAAAKVIAGHFKISKNQLYKSSLE